MCRFACQRGTRDDEKGFAFALTNLSFELIFKITHSNLGNAHQAFDFYVGLCNFTCSYVGLIEVHCYSTIFRVTAGD